MYGYSFQYLYSGLLDCKNKIKPRIAFKACKVVCFTMVMSVAPNRRILRILRFNS